AGGKPPPAPGPPNALTVGPAVGSAPVCEVAAVSRLYANGPASAATTASDTGPSTSTALPRAVAAVDSSHCPATRAAAAPSPASRTTTRSHGYQVGVRSSSTQDQTVVITIPAAMVPRPNQLRS